MERQTGFERDVFGKVQYELRVEARRVKREQLIVQIR